MYTAGARGGCETGARALHHRIGTGDPDMLDLAMIAIGCASFAILILYTAACDRM
jgi:hypothetical protein